MNVRYLPTAEIGWEAAVEWGREFTSYLVDECNLSHLTAYTYQSSLRRLERDLAKPACEFTVADIRRWMRTTRYHPTTKSASLVALKAFRRWGVLEGLWEHDGLLEMRGPKLISNPKTALTANEVHTLLAACRSSNTHRVVRLGLYAGLRISESAGIDDGRWVDERGRLQVFGKGRKEREVPIHPELARYRDRVLGKGGGAGTLKHACRSLGAYTGVPFTSHTLRRTFAVHLSEAGVGREVVGSLLGHAPLSVTETYAPVRWTEKVAAVSRLRY